MGTTSGSAVTLARLASPRAAPAPRLSATEPESIARHVSTMVRAISNAIRLSCRTMPVEVRKGG